MKHFIPLSILVLLFCVGCPSVESDPTTVNQAFTYTAVGDDGIVDQADRVQIRMSLSADSLTNDWSACTIIYELPSPAPFVIETVQATPVVMTTTLYFFAIKTVDESGNWSQISNIIEITYADVTPPSPITDFKAL